jgi:hypothetical protein
VSRQDAHLLGNNFQQNNSFLFFNQKRRYKVKKQWQGRQLHGLIGQADIQISQSKCTEQ